MCRTSPDPSSRISAATPWGTLRVRDTAGVLPTPWNGWAMSKTVGVSISEASLHKMTLSWNAVLQLCLVHSHIHGQEQMHAWWLVWISFRFVKAKSKLRGPLKSPHNPRVRRALLRKVRPDSATSLETKPRHILVITTGEYCIDYLRRHCDTPGPRAAKKKERILSC